MLRIGICDEDKKFVNHLVELISDILFQYTYWETEIFNGSKEVIRKIDKGEFDCNLLFMDVCLKENSGLEVAQYVNKKRIDTDIIFIASSGEYVFECYRYHTFAYLLKPLKQKEIEYEMKRYLTELKSNPKCLNITARGNTIQIPIDSIIYVESNYRKVIVHTDKGDYEYYDKMSSLEEILKNDGFIRCHQSYLVARSRIITFGGTELDLGQNMTVPVSRKYLSDVKEHMREDRESEDSEKNSYVTSSLSINREKTGALVCVKGAYIGAIVRIKPEQKILIGRDGSVADMVVNLPKVSRMHCAIIYHEDNNEYEVVDFSTNGTFVNGSRRLVQDDVYILNPGTTLSFGDTDTVYKLG
jgi:DNA-binding LytR/AlgR family response regulator